MSQDFTPGGQPQFSGDPGPPPKTSGKAIASLVLGLLSFVTCFFAGIPAIVFGVLGLRDINRSGGRLQGSGLATAGIATGCVGSLICCVLMPPLLLPAVQAARTAARRNQSADHLKLIGLAVHNDLAARKAFPAASTHGDDGQPLLSWRVAVLPYLEETALAAHFHLDQPWDSADNQPLVARCPRVYQAPGDDRNDGTETNVLGIVDSDTVLTTDGPVTLRDITDGTSKTIVAVELAGADIPWTEPRDITIEEFVAAMRRRPGEPGLHCIYPGGALCLFADGSVQFVSMDTDPKMLRGLCTRSGGEAAAVP